MSKRLLFLFLSGLLLAGIVACRSTTQVVQTTVAPPAAATPTKTPVQATPLPLPPTPLPPTSASEPTLTPAVEVTAMAKENPESPETEMVIPPTIEPTPPFEWQIPSIGEGEWVKGSDAAGMTLIEYGDYQ
ncbi:MAG: hypothetical protein JW934_17600 [Anaerolineae bacterium]|nr:hypothetical protein [Anaerolineae bacterium]